ncbi:hypothetical protein ACT6NV_13205 [Robiginitalea sp. IMCC44478]|uniref:hypothetical protein n=1 Tax=Robiginitalea sp. IMCC44478 TaxID=3459122 RepID=UPI0040425882
MNHIFRKLRKRLLDQKKVSRYLLYASGEIILVVVGILIALDLNNRNEERKSLARIESIFEKVLEELDSNIDETTVFFQANQHMDSLRYMVAMNKITLEDLKSYDSPDWNYIFELNKTYTSVSLTQKAYDQLMQNIDNIPQEYLALVDELSTLFETEKRRILEIQGLLYDALNENIRKRSELEFYQNKYNLILIANDKGFQDYILKDPRFKAETVHWMDAVRSQIDQVIIYREHALKCYDMISSKFGLESKEAKWKIDDEFIASFKGNYILSWGDTIEQTVKNGYPYLKWEGYTSDSGYMMHKVDETTYLYSYLYFNYRVKNDSVFIYSPRFNFDDKGWLATKILNDSL